VGLREDWEENNGGCCRVRSEMRGAAAGLCWVELETVRRKWEALPLLEVDVGVGVALASFFLMVVGSSVVVSLRFAFSQNQGKGKALVFSCAGRGKSWVEKGEVGSVSSRGGNAEVREIGGQRRCGCSLFLWFFGRGRESLVCREMGRRLQWQRGGSLVSQREGRPTWFQRVAASLWVFF